MADIDEVAMLELEQAEDESRSLFFDSHDLEENGTELDHSELPESQLRAEFLAAHGLEEGRNTAFYSTSAGKLRPEGIEWYELEDTLKKSYQVDEKDDGQSSHSQKRSMLRHGDDDDRSIRSEEMPMVKEERDELASETGNDPASASAERRLLHVRHLTTNYPIMMKKLKGGAWRDLDAGRASDKATDVLGELMKCGERVTIPLKGPFDLVPGRQAKNYLTRPITSPLGTIKTRGEDGGSIFVLHPQMSDEAEMEDFHAHGLIMNEKMMRDFPRPQFRETWWNSLVLLLGTRQCPFEVDIDVKVTLYPYEGPALRTGQNGKWTLAFDTELKVYGKPDVLIAQPTLRAPFAEHLRRVLHAFLPSPNNGANPAHGDITLKEFYDVLLPAPTPPADVLRLVQPADMVARLKPFQQRAVAWVLKNEDARSVHPYFARRSMLDPEGLWETVQFGADDEQGPIELAFCRMTGSLQPITEAMLHRERTLEKGKGKETGETNDSKWLSPEEGLLRLCDVRGSLLAEEMGLGKTLEAIATVLLHPRTRASVRPEAEAIKAEDMEETDALTDKADGESPDDAGSEDMSRKRRKTGKETMANVATEIPDGAFEGSVRWDDELKLNVHEIKSTLIVTPKILLRQWVEETKKHAPHLKYVVYEGYGDMMEDWLERDTGHSSTSRRKRETVGESGEMARTRPRRHEDINDFFQRWYDNWIRRMVTTDIVFVTFDTLGKDLDVAVAPVERPRRAAAGPPREKPRSVLSMCQFWRVIMDEVQMLDALSASKAARMVTTLQRVNSLVLSGTPAKQAVQDLQSALRFVGIHINPAVWTRFLRPGFRHAFRSLFAEVAIRHTKKMVKGETDMPPQTRSLVPIKMNIVELQYYRDTLYRNIDALAVSTNGYRDTNVLRGLVQTLRAVCTHMQTNDLGNRLRPGEVVVERARMARENGAVLKDMDQALSRMQVQAWRDYHHHVYLLQSTRIKYSLALHSEQPDAYQKAIDLLRRVDKESAREAETLQKMLDVMTDTVDLESDGGIGADEESNASLLESYAGQERTALKARILEFRQLSHEALFRCGDLYHQHLEQEGFDALETESYAAADTIRQVLLARPLAQSNSSIDRVRSIINTSRITKFEVLEVEEGGPLGIETAKYGTAINTFIDSAMNANAECLWNLRGEVVKRLLEKVDFRTDNIGATDDSTPTGQEFDASLRAQAELEFYVAAYTDAVADRREILTEGTTFIRQIERKKGKKRETRTAMAMAVDIPEDEEEENEYQEEVKMNRLEYREAYAGYQSLQRLISDLDDFISTHEERKEECELAKMEKSRLREIKEEQLVLLKRLEDEARSLNNCFNVRLSFVSTSASSSQMGPELIISSCIHDASQFKTLQQISDTLVDPDASAAEKEAIVRLTEPRTAERMSANRLKEKAALLETAPTTFTTMERQIATAQAHARYLGSLTDKNKEQEEDEECMICQQEFAEIKGFIMVLHCAHRMCNSCYHEYTRTAPRPTCPCCRLAIIPSQVHRVDLRNKQKEPVAAPTKAETLASETDIISDSLDLEALNVIPSLRQDVVDEVEIHGQWGAKLDFLIKHLKYWKRTKPAIKHIVFSAWASSLGIVQAALTANSIKWITIGGTKKAEKTAVKDFATNDCQVFLLHGERQVSGLTLTAAAVVHLLEPVLNQGYELQAIGRVDRLGQDKETHVFCYACEETIEAKIINRALGNGQCIYAKGIDQNAFDAEATTVSGKKGTDKDSGEQVELCKSALQASSLTANLPRQP